MSAAESTGSTGHNVMMPAVPVPPSGASGYPVRAVAERLGVPTATLRSWNRRYGIGPVQDRPGSHRLYTETDIALLERMLELIRAGVSPSRAAATARGPAPAPGDRGPLLAAAFALDTATVTAHLDAHLRAFGVVDTWETLCRPAFADIVARQGAGEGCIDVEHLLSWCIGGALQRAFPPSAGPGALLACTSGETHALPLDVLRAALAERGLGARMLGPDVPTAALVDALGRHAEGAAVVLWSHRESTALTSAVRACLGAGARVFVGGPGWDEVVLPPDADRLDSLAEAVDRLS